MFKSDNVKRIMISVAISIVLSVFLSFFASPSISPLYGLYEGSNFTYDPAVFKYEALAILSGQKPYIDFYDHKGIWHLGIYVLAMLISKDYGLLILEIISGAITIFFYIETIRTLTSSLLKKHIAVFIFIIIRFIVGTGAIIGIWLLPFTVAYLYFYLRGLKENKDHYLLIGSIFVGMEVAFSLNSRPLDIVFSWGGFFFIIVYLLKEKKIGLLVKNLIMMFISFIIPTAIIAAIAISNGFFIEMLQAMILDNFAYIGRNGSQLMERVLLACLSALVAAIYLIIYLIDKKKKADDSLGLFFFVNGLAAFFPLAFLIKYFSYFIGAAPIIGVSVVYFLERFPKGKILKDKILIWVTSAAAAILSLTPLAYYTFGLGDFSYSKNQKDVAALLTSIPEEDRLDGDVYAVDCSCAIYHILGVVSDTKYYCNQTWWSYGDSSIMEEAIEYVEESKPKYVILSKGLLSEKWEDILKPYSLVSDYSERFFIYKINL